MRKIILTLLIGLLSLSLYSQDSISEPTLLLRPYFENGIDFIRNDELKQNYEAQSKYFWGFGLQIGHPETFKIIPYVQFSMSKFEIEKTVAPNIKVDSALTTKQITGGLIIPLKKVDNNYFRARLGYSYSMIKESFYNIDSNSHGFQIGFGVERKIIGNSRIYFDVSYNFQKTGKSEFRDFDMTKFSFGLIL
jgi:opacity protein-like surface antigen